MNTKSQVVGIKSGPYVWESSFININYSDEQAAGEAFTPGSTVDQKIDADIIAKINYMRNHQPIPWIPAGSTAATQLVQQLKEDK